MSYGLTIKKRNKSIYIKNTYDIADAMFECGMTWSDISGIDITNTKGLNKDNICKQYNKAVYLSDHADNIADKIIWDTIAHNLMNIYKDTIRRKRGKIL